MSDNHTVTTSDELRDIIGHPNPLVQKKIIDRLDDVGIGFVKAAPLILLATADTDGRPDVSPRGDPVGSIEVVGDNRLLIGERPGNKLAMSLENILVNPQVGLMFMIPGVDELFRVHGKARLSRDPALLERLSARGKPALLVLDIAIEHCFLHCGKAMKRSRLWKDDARMKFDFRFGSTIAREAGGGAEMEKMVNEIVAEDYRDNL